LQSRVKFIEVGTAVDPQQLLLERPHEPFGDAVALRGPDEARARLDPEEADLGLEVVTDVLRAVVVAQGQAGGDARLEAAVDGSDALADRLEGLEAGGRLGRVQPQAFQRVVVDQGEDGDRPLGRRPGRGRIGAPIRSGAAVTIVPSWVRGPFARPARCGASRACSRISRNTRGRLVRTPWCHFRRAQTLRWPSPVNGAWRIVQRIRPANSASLWAVLGPRLAGGVVMAA
jgi:hypothetical protein